MSRIAGRSLVLLAVFLAGVAFGRAQQPPAHSPVGSGAAYDVTSFLAELQRLDGILQKKPSRNDLAALRDSLPREWIVTSSGSTFRISTQPLRNQLTALSSEKARAWLELLASEVSRTSTGTAPANAKAELDTILKEPEFAAVRPPSALELLRRRIAAWIQWQIYRLLSSVARYPVTGQILFWLVLVAAVLGIGLLVFRFIASRDRMQALPPNGSVVASRTWQEWIRSAREAAQRGDFREAVHSAYWAGIVRLQDAGILPADRTKTPREYLRLAAVSRAKELAPPLSCREPLADLTARLERTWYANRGAGPDDFRESLRQLEALGCQLD